MQYLQYAATPDRNNCVHDNRLTRTTDLLTRMRTYKCKLTSSHSKRLSASLVSGLTADAMANPFSRDSPIPSFGTQKAPSPAKRTRSQVRKAGQTDPHLA